MVFDSRELHYKNMTDDALVRAYLGYRLTSRNRYANAREQCRDYDQMRLIREVAQATGRRALIDAAEERAKVEDKASAYVTCIVCNRPKRGNVPCPTCALDQRIAARKALTNGGST